MGAADATSEPPRHDPRRQAERPREIFEFLHRLTDEGGSLLLVDQFATRALSMAKSVHIMRRGEMRGNLAAMGFRSAGDVLAEAVNHAGQLQRPRCSCRSPCGAPVSGSNGDARCSTMTP